MHRELNLSNQRLEAISQLHKMALIDTTPRHQVRMLYLLARPTLSHANGYVYTAIERRTYINKLRGLLNQTRNSRPCPQPPGE